MTLLEAIGAGAALVFAFKWGKNLGKAEAVQEKNANTTAIQDVAWFVPETDDPVHLGAGSGWRYDLRDMTAENWWVDFMSSRKEDREITYRYHLRRMDGPEWQILLTRESYEEQKKRISTQPAETEQEKATTAGTLEALGLGDVTELVLAPRDEAKTLWDDHTNWKPVWPAHQGDLEHRYQQYLRLISPGVQAKTPT